MTMSKGKSVPGRRKKYSTMIKKSEGVWWICVTKRKLVWLWKQVWEGISEVPTRINGTNAIVIVKEHIPDWRLYSDY